MQNKPKNTTPLPLGNTVQIAFLDFRLVPCQRCNALVRIVDATEPIVCPNPHCQCVMSLPRMTHA